MPYAARIPRPVQTPTAAYRPALPSPRGFTPALASAGGVLGRIRVGAAPSGAATPIQLARKKKKYAAVTESVGKTLKSVKIEGRPAFSSSTRKTLANDPKYANAHADRKRGTLKPGFSRNHIQAWANMKNVLAESLAGVKHEDVPDKINKVMNTFKIGYNPGKTRGVEAHIKKAGRVLFNHVENLRVGNSSANSADGSSMKHALDQFGKTYPGAKPADKSKIWYGSKNAIKGFGVDSSPSGKRPMEQKFSSPVVKVAMGSRINRRLVETPPSAQKGKRPPLASGAVALKQLLELNSDSDSDSKSDSDSN